MYQHHYSKFLTSSQFPLHFAAHSHHFWPDVTFDAQTQYWHDSSKLSDKKWEFFFSDLVPELQSLLSEFLGTTQFQRWVFGPNTHEFVMRLISCLDKHKSPRVLTTASEFYSFDRQIKRTAENANWQVTSLATEELSQPFEHLLLAHLKNNQYDFIFLSHVFFNSGTGWDIGQCLNQLKAQAVNGAIIAIDGYHSFGANSCRWADWESWAFLIGGSYKYLQGGEGVCFMSVPDQAKQWRPEYTGWFSLIGNLSSAPTDQDTIPYPDDAFRFAGSTFDFTALYRLRSVLKLFKKEEIKAESIHSYIQDLQKYFLENLKMAQNSISADFCDLKESNLIFKGWEHQGHFLTFNLPSTEKTKAVFEALKNKGILVDSRQNRLRIGFGMYQSKQMIDQFIKLIS